MANIDNPNGFRVIGHLSGGKIKTLPMKVYGTSGSASDAITKGDAMMIDDSHAGYVKIGTRGTLVGVAAHDVPSAESVSDIDVYADPNLIFEGQCSGTYSQAVDLTECDIEGATGEMEVNEDASIEGVIFVLGKLEAPDNETGAHTRVKFIIRRHALANSVAAK